MPYSSSTPSWRAVARDKPHNFSCIPALLNVAMENPVTEQTGVNTNLGDPFSLGLQHCCLSFRLPLLILLSDYFTPLALPIIYLISTSLILSRPVVFPSNESKQVDLNILPSITLLLLYVFLF